MLNLKREKKFERAATDLNRVGTDNLTIEPLRKLHGKPALAGARGTGYHKHLLLHRLLRGMSRSGSRACHRQSTGARGVEEVGKKKRVWRSEAESESPEAGCGAGGGGHGRRRGMLSSSPAAAR